ncbi:MAG TPA: multifunctional CCA addition/repair protein [Gammaproteobacteria bacterium]|nr:multifunctional CCA addition/repair protein [Gammaproteobacteria bacterium]
MKVYEVGGAVRDSLLGLRVIETDYVVVGATPDEMLALGYRQVGRDFPVFLHPETNDEYALARVERKTGRGHTAFDVDVAASVTLEDDLKRRDLTINAMARGSDGEIIDPYGGRKDLERRVLRHVSDAFAEDPLRVLRVARFAARFAGRGFSIADSTLDLMGTIATSGELEHLSAERIWQETEKALESDSPHVFFETLRRCAALAVVFPEIDRLFGVPQPARWHPEIDTGLHTLMALEQAAKQSDKAVVRFAVLVHDLGKGATPKTLLPRHFGHEQRSVELIDALGSRLRVPNRFLGLARSVARYHGIAHRSEELRPQKLLELLINIGALRDASLLEEFIAACEADMRGRAGLESAPYPQGDLLRRAHRAAAAVTADAVADKSIEGKALGDAIRKLRVDAIRREASGSSER